MSHSIDLISSQIEIVIILAGKAKTLLAVAYASRFRNAFGIKSCSYRICFIYKVFEAETLGFTFLIPFIL